jgi:amino acid transporter
VAIITTIGLVFVRKKKRKKKRKRKIQWLVKTTTSVL